MRSAAATDSGHEQGQQSGGKSDQGLSPHLFIQGRQIDQQK